MVLTRQGRWEEAQRRFEEALAVARTMLMPRDEASALSEYGHLPFCRYFAGGCVGFSWSSSAASATLGTRTTSTTEQERRNHHQTVIAAM